MTLSGSLVPGWALALLALTLTLPAAIASLDGLGRVMRRRRRVGGALGWAASRGLPLVAALMLLYILVLIGIVARPRFPFDPADFGIGAGEVFVMALLAGVVGAGFYRLRAWRARRAGGRRGGRGARDDLGGGGPGGLARQSFPGAVARSRRPRLAARRPAPTASWPAVSAVAALSLVPFAAALADMAGRLGLGSAAPWRLLLIVGDGQIGFASMIALCVLIGCLAGTVPSRPGAAQESTQTPGRRAAPARASAHPLDPRSGSRRSRPSGRISYRADPGH